MSARLFCFGHRGACGHEPENTLRAIRKALELGAGGVEIDVWLADGHLMVIHDRNLKRTTNGRGYIDRKSFAELRSLDAGNGERIPTLDEVLATVDRRAVVNVELKGPGTAEPVAETIARHIAERGWRAGDFLVSSFDCAQLRTLRALRPEIPLGLLRMSVPRSLAAAAEDMGAVSIHLPKEKVTPALVADAQRRGIRVLAFTVNEPTDIARMWKLGVDGVFSDFPERVGLADHADFPDFKQLESTTEFRPGSAAGDFP